MTDERLKQIKERCEKAVPSKAEVSELIAEVERLRSRLRIYPPTTERLKNGH